VCREESWRGRGVAYCPLMKVLFLSANLGGNVPPTVAIARQLSRRGVVVEVAGVLVDSDSGPVPDRVVQVECSWAPKQRTGGKPESLGPTLGRIFLSHRLAREAEALIRDREPDVVVVDCMALAVIKGANRSGVPVVILLHTFAEYWRRTFLRGPVAAMVGAWGFSPQTLWARASDRLLLTDPVLDPARNAPEFASYTWTGTTEVGAAPKRPVSDAPADRARIVVSFSTTPLPGMRRAYRNTIAPHRFAARGAPAAVLLGGCRPPRPSSSSCCASTASKSPPHEGATARPPIPTGPG
jgi:hypothetical protein